MKFIMMTFYNRGTEAIPIWEVWGHEGIGVYEEVGSFNTEFSAMSNAHSFGLPVMRGHSSYEVRELLDDLVCAKHSPV